MGNSNIVLGSITLRDYQAAAALRNTELIQKYNVAADTSDTGTGKTYSSLGTLHLLRQANACSQALVLTPKSVVTAFRRVADAAGLPVLDVLNVEKLKAGNTAWMTRQGKTFEWRAPPGTLLIVDEAHRFGGENSDNGKVLALAKAYKYPVLMLSATLAENPLRMRAPGFLMGLHNYQRGSFRYWCTQRGCYPSPFVYGKLEFPTGPSRLPHLKRLHDEIAPFCTRVRIADIPDFPECDTQPMLYDLNQDYTQQVNDIYAEMDESIANPPAGTNILTAKLRARQKVEAVKVPLLCDLVLDILDENRSAVVFFNFRDPLFALEKQLEAAGISCVTIVGNQGINRQINIDLFQNDLVRVALVMAEAGGVGLGLHDVGGLYPRTALLLPSYNAVVMKQCLGRIHRESAKSKALQRFVLAAGTIEEEVYRKLVIKHTNIDMINDGDLF